MESSIDKLIHEQLQRIDFYERITTPTHPTDHLFVDDPEEIGTCITCRWLAIDSLWRPQVVKELHRLQTGLSNLQAWLEGYDWIRIEE